MFHFGHNGYSVMADSGVDPIVSTHPRLLTNNEYRGGGPNLINLMDPQSLPYQSRRGGSTGPVDFNFKIE